MSEEKRCPLVSIVMPAYNAESWIEASVSSVLSQSWRNIELIAVNDGSKDGTGPRLDALSRKDSRLRPIHVENGGPALARNRGLEALSPESDYVMFIDSDDELAEDAVEYALKGAGSGAELTVFGFSIISADGSSRDYQEREQFIPAPDFGQSFARLYTANLLNQVWGKLYKTQLIKERGIVFRDFRWGEDRLFIFDCLEAGCSVQVLPQCKYRYIMHPGESLISRWYDKKFSVCLEIDSRAEELCRSFGLPEESQRDLRYMFAKSVFSCLTTLFAPSCTLSPGEKRAEIEKISAEPRVKRRCRDCSGGLPTALLCTLLRSGSPALIKAGFHLVTLTGKAAPKLFMSLKHRK